MSNRIIADLVGTMQNFFRIHPAASTGAPSTGAHKVGEIWMDSAGAVYSCTAAGTPGTWQQLGASDIAATIHAATAATPTDSGELGFWDSVTGLLRKVTWVNAWVYFKTKADSIYAAIVHTHAPLEDTLQNLLSSSPASPNFAWATDTKEKLFWDGANWYRPAMPDISESAPPDMGAYPHANRSGYTQEAVSNKRLSNVWLGEHDAPPVRGSIRFHSLSDRFQMYRDSDWRTVVTGFTFSWQTTESGRYVLCALDSGNHWIDLSTSNSIDVGANGVPIVQGGFVDMGANPIARPLAGGRF